MGVNDKVQEYIEKVCSLVKNKDVHHDIKLELRDHIQTLIEENLSSGASEEEAVEKAIAHMGDADLVGKQLDKTHKVKIDLGILIPILSISLLGLVSMYFLQTNNTSQIFFTSAVFYVAGILLMIGLYFWDYRKLLSYSKIIYTLTIITMILTVFNGDSVNGVPYLSIGFLHINFISVSPFFLIIALAGIFQDWNWDNSGKYILGLVLMAAPGFLILLTSLTTAMIYIIACVTLMFSSKARIYQLLIPVTGISLASIFFIITEPYRTKRLISFIDPNADPKGAGWIYIQLKTALTSAGFLGNRSGMISKNIPDLHTDFIFTYIIYTFGWLAAAVVITLILFFVLRMVNVAKTAKHSYGKLLVKGIIAILATQFVLSIAASFGLSPFLGISLPFMSYGGSQTIVDMMAVGLILSVYRRKNINTALVKETVV